MNRIVKLIKKSRFVFVCGNGGSASTAEHLTNDLFSKGIKAICLNSNVSIITMIANDFSYDEIFSKQLEIFADKGDMLITISCSGTSPNIVRAKEVAYSRGIRVHSFKVFENDRDYGKLEDKHLKEVHKIKNLL